MAEYPLFRPRRLRSSKVLRRLISETQLCPGDLVMPCFVTAGNNVREPIQSMPGVERLSVDNLIKQALTLKKHGVPGLLLFGVPQEKDKDKDKDIRQAYDENGFVPQAVRSLKKEVPEMVVITDICVCSYTSHGHCGVVKDGRIDNDETLNLLAEMALTHARAGADMVAPSAMMDGQVKAVRERLDKNGFQETAIMAYSAKYASAFYGPFREAAHSSPQFGDRSSYQMDPANTDEAIREVRLDIEEGADIVMVKPALAYLDVIYRVKHELNYPVAAYNVSGEYSLVKAAHNSGWVEEKKIALEILTSIKRAGADIIVTYYAMEAAKWIQQIRD